MDSQQEFGHDAFSNSTFRGQNCANTRQSDGHTQTSRVFWTAWWWMQPNSTGLSLFFGVLQGRIRKKQGNEAMRATKRVVRTDT